MSSVREDIAKLLARNFKGGWAYKNKLMRHSLEVADQILSLKYPNGQPKLGIISEDQSHECSMDIYADYTPEEAYREGIRDMLNSNFKRIEEKK